MLQVNAMSLSPDDLKHFTSRVELSTEAGCLLWGMRVVIPAVCQAAVLRKLHASHPGMKSLAAFMCGGPTLIRIFTGMNLSKRQTEIPLILINL